MQTNKFTLQQYSCLAGVLLLINKDTDAGAVYTDLEPDIEIQFDGETANINIDNYSGNDFIFLKTSIESYYYVDTIAGTYHYRSRRGLWIEGLGSIQNAIAGGSSTNGAGGASNYLPYDLLYAEIIDNDLGFHFDGWQALVLAHIRIGIDDDWGSFFGNWFFDPQNKYVGVTFIGEDECLHYGWIRCSMEDTANKLIIHDFAYESKCNTGIAAGDTIGDTTVDIVNTNNLDAVVYSFGNSVFVSLSTALNNAEIHVYNLEGGEIYQNILQNKFAEIKLDTPKGIYLVEIIADEGNLTKKVYLN